MITQRKSIVLAFFLNVHLCGLFLPLLLFLQLFLHLLFQLSLLSSCLLGLQLRCLFQLLLYCFFILLSLHVHLLYSPPSLVGHLLFNSEVSLLAIDANFLNHLIIILCQVQVVSIIKISNEQFMEEAQCSQGRSRTSRPLGCCSFRRWQCLLHR